MFNPVWNRPVKESDRSLDPLGMNRVTDRMLNDLLLGITTVTPRARYFSFYTWAVSEIARSGRANSYSQFCSQFRDLERAFMLACVAHEQESSSRHLSHMNINGSQKGRRVWRESDSSIPLQFSYFGNRLGGYGQYYRGSISNLGLITLPEEAAYEHATDLGIKMAEAFHGTTKHADMISDVSNRKTVTKKTLLQLGRKTCLCRLRDADSRDRDILRGLFFGTLPEMTPDSYALRRRKSLALILFCYEFASHVGISLSDQDLLDSCYFGQVRGDGRTYKVVIPSTLSETAGRWKTFRAHDYFAYCCEAVLACFLEYLGERERTLVQLLTVT